MTIQNILFAMKKRRNNSDFFGICINEIITHLIFKSSENTSNFGILKECMA